MNKNNFVSLVVKYVVRMAMIRFVIPLGVSASPNPLFYIFFYNENDLNCNKVSNGGGIPRLIGTLR